LLRAANDRNVALAQAARRYGVTPHTDDIDGVVEKVVALTQRLCPSASETELFALLLGRNFSFPSPVPAPVVKLTDVMAKEDAEVIFREFLPPEVGRRLTDVSSYLDNTGEIIAVPGEFDVSGTDEEAQALLLKFAESNYWLRKELEKQATNAVA
jgi:hypothetical protein